MRVSERIWRADHAPQWFAATPPDSPDPEVVVKGFVAMERRMRGVGAWYTAVLCHVGPTPFPSEALEAE